MQYNFVLTFTLAALSCAVIAAPAASGSDAGVSGVVVASAPIKDFNDMVKISAESLVNPPVDLSKASKDDLSSQVDQLVANIKAFVSAANQANVDAATLERVVEPYVQYVKEQIHAMSSVDPSFHSGSLQSALQSLSNLISKANSALLVARDDTAAAATSASASANEPSADSTSPWAALVTTDSDGTKLFIPVQALTSSLLNNTGTASTLYKGLDSLDHVVDGTVAFLGNALNEPTGGLSSEVADFLGGPIVQSVNHGTFATLSTVLGSPVDGLVTNLAPAASSVSNSVSKFITAMNKLNVSTSSTQAANQLLQQRLQQIDSSMTFN